MTTVFHGSLCGRFIEIQSNLRRKKLHITNQGFNFHVGSFSNRDNPASQKTDNPSTEIYVHKIENRILFKIKTGYYLELVTHETINYLEALKVK